MPLSAQKQDRCWNYKIKQIDTEKCLRLSRKSRSFAEFIVYPGLVVFLMLHLPGSEAGIELCMVGSQVYELCMVGWQLYELCLWTRIVHINGDLLYKEIFYASTLNDQE